MDYPIIPVADNYKVAVQRVIDLQAQYSVAYEALAALELQVQQAVNDRDLLKAQLAEVAAS